MGFLELYQQRIRDLLDTEHRECFLREDDEGNVQLRGHTENSNITENNESDNKEKEHSRAVKMTRDVTRIRVSELADINECIAEGMRSRNVGRSTLHEKSSRSHAFLEFEIVSAPLIDARTELRKIEAEIGQFDADDEEANSNISKRTALKWTRRRNANGSKSIKVCSR